MNVKISTHARAHLPEFIFGEKLNKYEIIIYFI